MAYEITTIRVLCSLAAGLMLVEAHAASQADGVGPQSTIACPAGAVPVSPGASLQAAVDARPGGTAFCLRAGIHPITGPTVPKTGNTFVGEYGAILDGATWQTTVAEHAAIYAQNADVDNVTVRNLVIRNMPQRGIHAFKDHSSNWQIDHVEISGAHIGVHLPDNSAIRDSWIHHNAGDPNGQTPAERGGGYGAYLATGVTFEHNEISYNGTEQKVLWATNVTFRNNWVHHNQWDGIWFDGDKGGALVEGNRVEDNAGSGIFYEISTTGVIRNNTVRRSEHGIFVSVSKDADISGNTLEDNFRGIEYFLLCSVIGVDGADLANDHAHDNAIRVNATPGAFAAGFTYSGTCAPGQADPYLNGQKGLRFTSNRYSVPAAGGAYWVWGGGLLTLGQWRGLGFDLAPMPPDRAVVHGK